MEEVFAVREVCEYVLGKEKKDFGPYGFRKKHDRIKKKKKILYPWHR